MLNGAAISTELIIKRGTLTTLRVFQFPSFHTSYYYLVSGRRGDRNNHSIKGTTLEINVFTFIHYPCFMMIDHEMKEN